MLTRFVIMAGGAALLLAQPAFAHHPSGVGSTGGAGPINTVSASPLDKGETAASITFEWIKFDPLSNAFLADFGATHGHDVHVHSLSSILAPAISVGYGITADFTISARLPVVVRTDIKEATHMHPGGGAPAVGAVDFLGDSAGIGDLSLLGQYRFYNNRATQTELALLLGVKAPTGVTNRHTDTGELFDAEFQPGSGSWDGLFGLAATKRIGPWSFDANVLYVLATEGTQSTDLADRFQYNAAVSFRLLQGASAAAPMKLGALPDPMWHGGPSTHQHSHMQEAFRGPALDLVVELNGEWHAKEVQSGVTDSNSGGNTLYLAPGLRFSKDNWSSYLSVGIPIINDLNGIQAEPEIRVVTGLSVTF
jgi:hypothetical protein